VLVVLAVLEVLAVLAVLVVMGHHIPCRNQGNSRRIYGTDHCTGKVLHE
jgi:hypothetical protein